jgi:Ca2+-binding RTX toxin-like protein
MGARYTAGRTAASAGVAEDAIAAYLGLNLAMLRPSLAGGPRPLSIRSKPRQIFRPDQRSFQPIKQESMMNIFNNTSSLAGGASQTSNWLTGEQTIKGGAGNDAVLIDKASGLAGMLGLYEVNVNGQMQYMSKAELERTQFNLGAGDDVMVVSEDVKANIKVNGGQGNDVLITGGGNDRVQGGAGQDIIYTAAGHDTVHGNQGNDWIHGGGGNDTVNGGSGTDKLDGGEGKNKVQRDLADIFPWLSR